MLSPLSIYPLRKGRADGKSFEIDFLETQLVTAVPGKTIKFLIDFGVEA
jgi:hypothetical protein